VFFNLVVSTGSAGVVKGISALWNVAAPIAARVKNDAMATDKQKVLAYLHTAVYERLALFKQVHGIGSLSKAVEMVLCDYFDINVPGVVLPVTLETLKSRIAPLESSPDGRPGRAVENNDVICADARSTKSFPKGRLANASLPQQRNALATNVGTPLPSSRVLAEGLSASVVKKGLTGVVLASRLNSYSSTISKNRSKPKFSEWTRALDPDGIAWEYRAITRRFHPVELRKN
jgi:hypothetical protein